MKAVLLNSADKLAGIHGSSRDIYLKDGVSRWHNTPAASDISIPLDQEMGAGHLNVQNAMRQYRTGEWDGISVPNIGWDYGTVGGSQSYIFYEFNRPLAAGEVVAATLCWDRRVETISPDQDDYTQGFFDYSDLSEVLVDLDLYLMEVGGDPNDTNDIYWLSVSSVDNVEHIFIPIQDAGNYQLVVFNSGFGLDDGQDFGLAWWAGESLSGDFDGDDDVDSDDMNSWKTGFASSEADADYDGDSDGTDFLAWQRNLGTGVPVSPAFANVPEPGSRALLCLGLSLFWRRRVSA